VNLLEQISNRKEQIETEKRDLENLEKDLARLENDYIKTFQVGEKAIQKGYWSENSPEETEIIITAIKYDYYLDEPCYQIYTVSLTNVKNGHEARQVIDLTKLRKANLCDLCDAVIPASEAFCGKCEAELNEEVKAGTEEVYPCVGCGTMIPITEPFCKECEKDFETKKAA